MKATRSPQWVDKGTYKEPIDGDNIRVPRLEVDDATTYVDKDGSDNLTLTDAVTGTKTLAELNGAGDVTGPASSRALGIAAFADTTGKVLLNDGGGSYIVYGPLARSRLISGGMGFTDTYYLTIGSGTADAKLLASITDADAYCPVLSFATPSATRVPVFILNSRTAFRYDYGLFDGLEQPTLAVIEKDCKYASATDATSDGADLDELTNTGAFTNAVVGDIVRITAGTRCTAGWYWITDVSGSPNSVTLDREFITADGAVSDIAYVVYHDFVLVSADGIKTGITDGAPDDDDVEIKVDGWLKVDVGNNKFYFRSQSVWQSVVAGADVTGDNAPQAHGSGHADGTDDVTDLVGDSGSGGTHGLAPAPSAGDAAAGKFLKADGVWTAPAGGGDVTGPASSTDNEIARQHDTSGKVLQTYTSNPPTISDTGDVNIDGDLDVENIVVSGNVDGRDVSADGTKLDNVVSNTQAITHAITDNKTVTVDGTTNAPVNSDYAKWTANGLEGMEKSQILSDLNVADGADVTGSNAPQAHKDSHDPDGSDPLDCAAPDTNVTPEQANAEGDASTVSRSDHMHYIPSGAPSELAGVQAAAEGTGAAFARTDHAHQIQASIADDHIVTIDHATPIDNDYAKFTASGLEGRSYTEALTDLLSATLPEDTVILLDALLSADEHWSGTAEIGTMGYGTTTVGDLMYLGSDGKWELAKADAASTSKGKLGLCLEAVAEDATCNVLLWGKMRSAAFPALTVGGPVHISAATAGDMAVAAPTGTTNFVVRIIGYGNTAEDLFFCPDNSYVELA